MKNFKELSENELVDYVNKQYKEVEGINLEKIAEELGTSKAALSSKLKEFGYKFTKKQYVKVDAGAAAKKMAEIDAMYLLTAAFNKQISHKVNGDTYKEFEALCNKEFPNIPTSKLVSLALKEFVEKHNK